MTAAISTKNLGKIYRVGFFMRRVVGLRGLDLEVGSGEAFGFIGPNGAGKTTAIKILMGLQAQTSGTAQLFGVDVGEARAREKVGFLPERPYFYEHLTAREVLHFYGQLSKMDRELCSDRVEMLLERMQLTRFADITLGKYSKGMLQRVGLCQTLLHDPELLVLDEPMSGLDPVGRALVRDLILEQREAGKTVFFSSHILTDVEAICDRVAILVGGELRACGSIKDVVADRENLESVLVGEMTKVVDESALGVL
jgi:ABC-2 type transport system ATP-binding protein